MTAAASIPSAAYTMRAAVARAAAVVPIRVRVDASALIGRPWGGGTSRFVPLISGNSAALFWSAASNARSSSLFFLLRAVAHPPLDGQSILQKRPVGKGLDFAGSSTHQPAALRRPSLATNDP